MPLAFKTIDFNDPVSFAPFDGDGRKKVSPSEVYKQVRPEVTSLSITRGMARAQIERFMEIGYSNHSASGATLWVIETWCYVNDIEIKIIKHPFGGYQVKQLEQECSEPVELEESEEHALEYGEQSGFEGWERMLADRDGLGFGG